MSIASPGRREFSDGQLFLTAHGCDQRLLERKGAKTGW